MRFITDSFDYVTRMYRTFITEWILDGGPRALVRFESDGVIYYKVSDCEITGDIDCKFDICRLNTCTGWYVDVESLTECHKVGGRMRKLADDFWTSDYKPHLLFVGVDWYGPFWKCKYSNCLSETVVFSRDERKESFESYRSYSEL